MLRAALEAEAALSADVVVMLRKLAKKDETTRLRGLAELLALAREPARAAQCAELLPHFVPPFARLAADGSRRVREQACVLLGVLGSTLGRALAPHLRALLPPLLWASCDAAPEVAAAASGAFAAMLPSRAKRADALLFAQRELFARSTAAVLAAAPPYLSARASAAAEADGAAVELSLIHI